MNCASHPGVETNLTCSKCGRPICPRCLVETPVGARCKRCARVSGLPTYSVSVQFYFRAMGTALGMAIVCGIAWGFLGEYLRTLIPISFNLILSPAAGYGIGEVTSLAVNHKRSKGLAAIGGLAMMLCFAIAFFFFNAFDLSLFNAIYGLLALGIGIFVAINRLR